MNRNMAFTGAIVTAMSASVFGGHLQTATEIVQHVTDSGVTDTKQNKESTLHIHDTSPLKMRFDPETNNHLEGIARKQSVRPQEISELQGDVNVYELVSDFSFGYRCGVKQPLGAFKNGLSLHQLTKSNYPEETNGNPDYILWVDETAESFGVAERPTGEYNDFSVNPGGMVAFSDNGTIWYVYGGRAQYLPIDLYSSVSPFDTSAFVKRVDDVDLGGGSTTPCVNVHGNNLMLFWRHRNPGNPDVAIRMRRYDITNQGDFGEPDLEIELVHGEPHETLDLVGIEQLWTRYDPRFNYTLLAWHFKTTTDPPIFGSDSVLYSDDDGTTWRKVDGSPAPKFPVQYSDIDSILTPWDHLAKGGNIGWLPNGVGMTPNGTFWLTSPEGVGNESPRDFTFRFFNGEIWEERILAEIGKCKPFACGTSKDLVGVAYADISEPNLLKVRLSDDDGRSWGDPIVLDALDETMAISWVSFLQPSDAYADNSLRFFYAYYRLEDGPSARWYMNNIRWVRFNAGDPPPVGDLDGDGVVGTNDLLILLANWGPCGDCNDCPADLDDDCNVGTSDLLILLANWG